jgi:hypothetical protein
MIAFILISWWLNLNTGNGALTLKRATITIDNLLNSATKKATTTMLVASILFNKKNKATKQLLDVSILASFALL